MKLVERLLRRWFKLLPITATLVFMFLVWPTPYRYDHLLLGGNNYPVRVNRITGSAEALANVGWTKLVPQPAAPGPKCK